MTVQQPPGVLNGVSTDSKVQRNSTAALVGGTASAFSGGVGVTNSGGHGVSGFGHLAVSQSGTPAMSVQVASGRALITGTVSAEQGTYSFYNNGAETLAVAAADAVNARRDLVVAQIRDAAYSGVINDARLFVVTGTPAGSPVDPALPDNCLVLARVTVAALATSITNANITDLRTFATSFGGIHRAIPAAAPVRGDTWFDDVTGRLMRRVNISGTDYSQIIGGSMPACNCTRTTTIAIATGGGLAAVNLLNEIEDTDAFHGGGTNVFTIPAGLGGDYLVTASCGFAANGTGYRRARVDVGSNASQANELALDAVHQAVAASAGTTISTAKEVRLEAGATLTLEAAQTSGVSLNVSTAYMTLRMVQHLPNLT